MFSLVGLVILKKKFEIFYDKEMNVIYIVYWDNIWNNLVLINCLQLEVKFQKNIW